MPFGRLKAPFRLAMLALRIYKPRVAGDAIQVMNDMTEVVRTQRAVSDSEAEQAREAADELLKALAEPPK